MNLSPPGPQIRQFLRVFPHNLLKSRSLGPGTIPKGIRLCVIAVAWWQQVVGKFGFYQSAWRSVSPPGTDRSGTSESPRMDRSLG